MKSTSISLATSAFLLSSCGLQETSFNVVCSGSENVIQTVGSQRNEYQEKTKSTHSYSFSLQDRDVISQKDGTEVTKKLKVWSVLIDGKELLFDKDTQNQANQYQGEISKVEVTDQVIKISSESKFHPKSTTISSEDKSKLLVEIDRVSGNWHTAIAWYSFMSNNGYPIKTSMTSSTSEIEGQCIKTKENKI